MTGGIQRAAATTSLSTSAPHPPQPRSRPAPAQPAGQGTDSARWIAVTGVCGRAGTTTMAALLGATFAAHRRYRIVVVDADPTGGALGVRLSGGRNSTLAEIAAAAPGFTSFSQLAPYIQRTSTGVWAVAGPAADLNECRAAVAALSPFFAVVYWTAARSGTRRSPVCSTRRMPGCW